MMINRIKNLENQVEYLIEINKLLEEKLEREQCTHCPKQRRKSLFYVSKKIK